MLITTNNEAGRASLLLEVVYVSVPITNDNLKDSFKNAIDLLQKQALAIGADAVVGVHPMKAEGTVGFMGRAIRYTPRSHLKEQYM